MPNGTRFSVIVSDPPWRYAHSRSSSRKIDEKYPTMSTAEIAALDVPARLASLVPRECPTLARIGSRTDDRRVRHHGNRVSVAPTAPLAICQAALDAVGGVTE